MKIWDNHNKQWLIVTGIYFNQNGDVERITANVPGQGELGDPFYNIYGKDLDKVGIHCTVTHNEKIVPK